MNILTEFPFPWKKGGSQERGGLVEEEKKNIAMIFRAHLKTVSLLERQYRSAINMAWLYYFLAAS